MRSLSTMPSSSLGDSSLSHISYRTHVGNGLRRRELAPCCRDGLNPMHLLGLTPFSLRGSSPSKLAIRSLPRAFEIKP